MCDWHRITLRDIYSQEFSSLALCYVGSHCATTLTFFSPPHPPRRESMCCGVRLQVHWDLCGSPAQREGAVWGHCTAGSPSAGQQGEERPAPGLPEEEGEHPQESQALLGQDCGQKQEYGLQAQVQVLPWPLCAIGTQNYPDVPLMDIVEGHWDW